MKFLTLALAAVLTLAFSFTTTPAAAAPSGQDRCKRQVAKAERNHAGCVTGVAARSLRFGQQTGAQAAALSECETRRDNALGRIATKFPSLAAQDCGLDGESADARAQAALVVAGLADPTDPSSDNQSVCEAAGGTWENDDCTAADLTTDNQSVCEAAGGTWESGACTVASSYNCAIGAICSNWAARYPSDLPYYTNNYVGDTAASTECDPGNWAIAGEHLLSYAIGDYGILVTLAIYQVCQ